MFTKSLKRVLLGLFLLILLGLLIWLVVPMLRIGTGYATKMTCSCAFIQDREAEDVQRRELNFSVLPYVRTQVDRERRMTTGNFLGIIRRTAQYIPGRGCVLLSNEAMPLPQPIERPAPARPWRWPEATDSLLARFDQAALDSAFAFGMRPLPGGGTRGLVLIYEGQLIRETYDPAFSADTPQLGWSMAKSLTNALIGILVKQGTLQLKQQALFEEWKDDERRQISLEDLLHMNSGLDWNEAYSNITDATRMLYLEPNFAAYARRKSSVAPPGTQWVYSSGTTNLISRLIRNQFEDDATHARFPFEALFGPLGIENAYFEPDQSGTVVGSSYGWLRPRDWAKVGQLYLQDGIWEGARLLPEGWVDFSTTPAAGSDGAYGAQIWLRTEEIPDAPADSYSFRGFQDQRVFVFPTQRAVLVRIGRNDDKVLDFNELLKRMLLALPGD